MIDQLANKSQRWCLNQVRNLLVFICLIPICHGCQPWIQHRKEIVKVEPTSVPTPTQEDGQGTRGPSTPWPATSATEDDQTAPASSPGPEKFVITILYDNNPYRTGLETDWGFAALVAYGEENVLFDTGKSSAILLSNMGELGIRPQEIDYLVLSHAHRDHRGGVEGLYGSGAHPAIYLLPSFSSSNKRQLGKLAEIVEVKPGQRITERVYTTGEISGTPPEQALVLDSPHGLVVITGCAHPGIVKMVKAAKQELHEVPYMVIGGFHLGSKSTREIQRILQDFRKLGVAQVAPCHCTGERARRLFAQEYGENYIAAGVGRVIEIIP